MIEAHNDALADLRSRARHRWESDRLPDGWTRPLPPAPELPELPEVLVLDAEEDPLVVPDSPASAKEFAGWFVLEVHAGSTAVAARMHRETFDNCSMTIEPRSFVSRVT